MSAQVAAVTTEAALVKTFLVIQAHFLAIPRIFVCQRLAGNPAEELLGSLRHHQRGFCGYNCHPAHKVPRRIRVVVDFSAHAQQGTYAITKINRASKGDAIRAPNQSRFLILRTPYVHGRHTCT